MIVGFNIDSIEGSRGSGAEGELQVQYDPEIESVESARVNAFDDEVARIDFTFAVRYVKGGAEAAKIELRGNILWSGDTEEVVESWEEDEKLPENIEAPLMNDLYRKCLSESVGIADSLNLLPPFPTPTVERTGN